MDIKTHFIAETQVQNSNEGLYWIVFSRELFRFLVNCFGRKVSFLFYSSH